jgi:hypothetical protein
VKLTVASALLAGVTLAGTVPQAMAQAANPGASGKPAAAQPVRRGKVYKKPLVDLEKQADSRRPGQVLPGDPPPEKFAAPIPEPKSAPEVTPPAAAPMVPVAEPRDAKTGQPLKSAPTPVDPASGPRPLPKGAEGGAGVPHAPAPAADSHAAAPLDAGVTPVPGSATASADDGVHGSMAEPPAPAAMAEPSPVLKPAVIAVDAGVPAAASASAGTGLPVTPAAVSVSNEPVDASVRVVSASAADVEWRPLGGAWKAVAPGESQVGRFEVRTGLDGTAVVEIDGRVEVLVAHLSRVRFERRSADFDWPAVMLERGSVELRANSADPVEVWVRTPDRTAGFSSLPGLRIGYSAFSGTSIQTPGIARP